MIDPAPQPALLAVLTTGVGAVMIRLGVDRGLLLFGRGKRRCPSCGRLIPARVCPVCAGQTRMRPGSARFRADDR